LAKAQTRGWAIGLGLGLLAAGLVQSTLGLGLRHMLVFLPLQWAFLAAILAQESRPAARAALAAAVALVVFRQTVSGSQALAAQYPLAERVRADTELASTLARFREEVDISIDGGRDNAFFCLKFLLPGRRISFTERAGPDRSEGLIHLSRGTPRPPGGQVLASRLIFNDGASYAVVYHRAPN
ncbi:MAG: hypothetical protein PHU21_02935, partial [Elusimicrobia bacterium]|nr:hypothetical protein [Elusimicrobiota bacterium]